MKQYTTPALSVVTLALCDVILTSVSAPEFAIDADKTAGKANWLDAWNSLL
ncbi:MAG: hypothetical protein IJU41_05945 [Clostridia bacterium]|nr:hypothetical protein [Clostridia bacterium]